MSLRHAYQSFRVALQLHGTLNVAAKHFLEFKIDRKHEIEARKSIQRKANKLKRKLERISNCDCFFSNCKLYNSYDLLCDENMNELEEN